MAQTGKDKKRKREMELGEEKDRKRERGCGQEGGKQRRPTETEMCKEKPDGSRWNDVWLQVYASLGF